MLYKDSKLDELYKMKHRSDDDNMFVDYINLNTNTYQIDSGIRPTNCDWA